MNATRYELIFVTHWRKRTLHSSACERIWYSIKWNSIGEGRKLKSTRVADAPERSTFHIDIARRSTERNPFARVTIFSPLSVNCAREMLSPLLTRERANRNKERIVSHFNQLLARERIPGGGSDRGGSRLFNSIVRSHFQPCPSHTVAADCTAIRVRSSLSPSLSPCSPLFSFSLSSLAFCFPLSLSPSLSLFSSLFLDDLTEGRVVWKLPRSFVASRAQGADTRGFLVANSGEWEENDEGAESERGKSERERGREKEKRERQSRRNARDVGEAKPRATRVGQRLGQRAG